MTYEELLSLETYSLSQVRKNELFIELLGALTEKHRQMSYCYADIIRTLGYDRKEFQTVQDIPFLPVRLFKHLDLMSIPKENIFKMMTSSGTSGQQVSKIYLDRETASWQQKTLVKIVSSFIGKSRLPMIILDCPSVLKNRRSFSARGAGILGFSMFGRKSIYALNDNMDLQYEVVRDFLQEHKGEDILLFGFTFMVWKYFLQAVKDRHLSFDLSNGFLLHGGGWKKLAQESVSNEHFRQELANTCGLKHVHSYYGMVEQTGPICMECEAGHLHVSNCSDIIMRRSRDFSPCDIGEPGIVQVLTPMPQSYPGHSLLTEDEGVLLGVDDCPCGRKGKYFKIMGRLANAELRGCSDTYAVGR